MVICHALSGSADVADWWGPLMGGKGRAFDTTRFFIICINALGSPYGSASPVTARDGDISKGRYGPEFPLTTIRDDVRLQKLLLDDLGVKQIAAVVGGSMGGMLVLEYAYFGPEYVKCIVPIATSARHSAWCISWGENQRQCIFGDPKYEDGYYAINDPPVHGLGEARGSALLTYRSRDSFETRFGRNPSRNPPPASPVHTHFSIHNEGHKKAGSPRSSVASAHGTPVISPQQATGAGPAEITITDPQFHGATPLATDAGRQAATNFSAHSYLRYQKEKFITRFDANCYIAITRKLDTHDVAFHAPDPSAPDALETALGQIAQPTLVLGIQSDGLFTFAEQAQIAQGIPGARLEKIDSPEGHDAFLLQFQQVNSYVLAFLRETLPEIFAREGGGDAEGAASVGEMKKTSTFGEAEVEDITAW